MAMTATIQDLREKLPIAYVMEQYGYLPHGVSGSRIHYVNPWRDDEEASLDVFTNDNGVQRWGDFATSEQGSVIDIIQKEAELTINEALLVARKFYGEYLASDWKGPEGFNEGGQKKKTLTREEMDYLLELGSTALLSSEVVYNLLTEKPALTAPMLEGWGLRVYDNRLLIPYPGEPALKYRFADGEKSFAKGSKPGLYHLPGRIDDETKPVLMVEGETDTWVADHRATLSYSVYGVSGVSTRPEKVANTLKGRDMVIFFDGDEAGRAGAVRWSEWCTANGGKASIVPTPDGKDVSDLSEADFWFLVKQRRTPVVNTLGLVNLVTGYGTQDKQGEPAYISNWTLDVTTLLRMEDGTTAYEGTFRLSGHDRETVILTGSDLKSPNALNSWCRRYGGSFSAGPTVPSKLDNLLASESYMAPILPGTATPGLKGSTFAWPHDYIGNTEVRSFENLMLPMSKADAYDIVPNTDPGNTMSRLLHMHTPEVIVPILSWLAMAPLRSKYKQFPPLFVTGKAGSGKTTLVSHAVHLFSGVTFSSNLTSTTQFGLTNIMGGSNAFPTWFDEYRPGARKDTKEMMDQMLRDAYDRASSYRGGMGDNYSALTATTTDNPLIVSGEDFADETSHRDRIIKIFVPNGGKGELPRSRPLAAHYLGFLSSADEYGVTYVDQPPLIIPSTIEGLTDRQAYNIGVLDAGYHLLSKYCQLLGVVLPDADWSLLIKEMEEDSHGDQVLDGVRSCYENKWNEGAVVRDGDYTLVHSQSVITLCRNMNITLPVGTTNALSRYLIGNYGGTMHTENHPVTGKRRMVKLPFNIEEV